MSSIKVSGTTVVFSNANQANSEVDYTTDASLNIVQYLDVLGQAGKNPNTILWSIGSSEIAANGWTTQGSFSVPTELLAQDTAYNIDSGTYKSALGANIFLTGATGLVGYDTSAMSAATKALIDNLAADQWIADSFDYAIRTGNGTLSWNTVTVVIAGAAAQIEVTGGSVQEGGAVDQNGNLHDTETISVRAASGNATAFTVTPAYGQTLGNTAVNGDGSFTYTVSEAAVLATHMGYGESRQDWFTVTTANGTTLDFYETVYGNFHAPVVTAAAAQSRIRTGQSVSLSIAAQDNDHNAQLTYAITGVPADATLSSAADPAGVVYDPAAQSWAVSAGALADLTLNAGLAVSGQLRLTVTVTNTETNLGNPADIAVASATATIDITVDGNVVVRSGTTTVGGRFEAGSTQMVEAGGIADSAFVETAGTQDVFGTASATTVFGGGAQIVEIGGNALGSIISNGAFQDVRGTASGAMVVGGGTQLVDQSGIAQATFLADNAAEYVYGAAIGTVVSYGGVQIVGSGGLATATTVNMRGLQVIENGGTAAGTTITSGGNQTIHTGGTASGTTLANAAVQFVAGTASGTTIGFNGGEVVSAGGMTTSTFVGSGGFEVVSSGGIASGTIIGSGGFELILSGGTSIDATISGGLLRLQPGASVAGGISFVGSGGIYEIDGSAVPANTVFGFAPGDVIDFATVAGGAADTVTLGPNNLLTILDQSSHAYSLHLDPVQNFSGQTFFLRDDGHGGTSVNLIGVPHI